tara:strand:+ start:9848 stop:10180 length:333 start_codon:yes stop_codon:yes gene_type:complete
MQLPFEEFEATAANDNHMSRWAAKFEQFHADNPEIYDLVKKYTFDVIRSGKKHIGINSIFERIRWYTDVETRSDCDFKINQNFTPYYARLFMSDHPQHDGFFSTRRLRSK